MLICIKVSTQIPYPIKSRYVKKAGMLIKALSCDCFSPRLVLYSLIVPVIFLSVNLFTIYDYGETIDETFTYRRGRIARLLWQGNDRNFVTTLTPQRRNYGPLFDYLVVLSRQYLGQKYNWFKTPVAAGHFASLLTATFTLWLVFVSAYFLWGLPPAFFGCAALALIPRFIAHAQSNLKDTPAMFFSFAVLLLYYIAVKKRKPLLYLMAGMGLGIYFCVRIHAALTIPIVCLWFGLDKLLVTFCLKKKTQECFPERFKVFLTESVVFSAGIIASLATAFLTVPVFWHYYRDYPFFRFLETFRTFGESHLYDLEILYLGQAFKVNEIPWHYPLVMFGVILPVFHLVLLLASLVLTVKLLPDNSKNRSALLFFLLAGLMPPALHVLKGSPMYDGIRHWLLVLPPFAMLIGFTLWTIYLRILTLGPKAKIIFWTSLVACFLHLTWINISLHPYQGVYFNELTGGVKGADGVFDLDNVGYSLLKATKWINKNIDPQPEKIKVVLPFWGPTIPLDKERFSVFYKHPDPDLFIAVNHVLLRNEKFFKRHTGFDFKQQELLHEVSVKGVTLAWIYRRVS